VKTNLKHAASVEVLDMRAGTFLFPKKHGVTVSLTGTSKYYAN